MSTSHADLCATVAELARQGGQLAAERLGHATASLKEDQSWVTDVDRAVQKHIVEHIAARFPTHAVVAEETVPDAPATPPVAGAAYCWIIDPIDGTRNYVRSFPIFTTTIALLHDGAPIAAATYDPLTDRMYSASKGDGTRCNDQPVSVCDQGKHFDTMVGIPSDRPLPAAVRSWNDDMVLRCTGSTALQMALVGGGALDAAYAQKTCLWDIAAGVLLVTEAGGVVTDLRGQPIFPFDLAHYGRGQTPFLAAGPKLHAELLASLR